MSTNHVVALRSLFQKPNKGYDKLQKSISKFKKYPDVLSVKELSELLSISIKTAYKLLQNDQIEHVMIGGIYRVPKICVLKYLGIKYDSGCNFIVLALDSMV